MIIWQFIMSLNLVTIDKTNIRSKGYTVNISWELLCNESKFRIFNLNSSFKVTSLRALYLCYRLFQTFINITYHFSTKDIIYNDKEDSKCLSISLLTKL